MYPTLKESMMLTITDILPLAINISDIIVYQQNGAIVAHRVIDIIRDDGGIAFIAKGDNQPFGGIAQIRGKDLIGKVEGAFYKDLPGENILTKKRYHRLLYVWLGRAFLVFRKFKRYLPGFLKTYLRYVVKSLYFALGRTT